MAGKHYHYGQLFQTNFPQIVTIANSQSGPGEFSVTAGWGVTGFEEGLSPTLRMLQVRFLAVV